MTRREYYLHFVIPLNQRDVGGGTRKFIEESVHYRMMRNFQPGELATRSIQRCGASREQRWSRVARCGKRLCGSTDFLTSCCLS